MKNSKLKKFILLIILSLSIFYLQTVAYSAMSSTLSIAGNAIARVAADVRITGFRLGTTLNASSNYEEFGKNHISTEVNLTNTSSKILYYIEITNYGSNDIGILGITGLPDGVTYSLSNYNLHDKICDDTGKCNNFSKKTLELTLATTSSYSGNIKMNFDFRTFHKVTYTGIENMGYPTEVIDGGDLNITFKENLKKVSFQSNGIEVSNYSTITSGQTITINNINNDIEVKILKPAKLVSGLINQLGSEVCIEEECFYIINNDGSTVLMISKYNLYVGGVHDGSLWTAYGDEATGKQNSTMLGYKSGQPTRNGVTPFSETSNAYTGSIVETYVNNYKKILEQKNINIQNARLITLEELEDTNTFSCVQFDRCPTTNEFIYSTSYWVGTASGTTDVWRINSNRTFNDNIFSQNDAFGVRPVIEISIDDIDFEKITNIVSGNPDTVGSEICIQAECFNVISSDTEYVTLLAKKNITISDTPVQSDTAGITPYATSTQHGTTYPDYNGSLVEVYVNNYKNVLETYGVIVSTARLITYDELNNQDTFKCDYEYCSEEYPWIYSTSYWTSSIDFRDYMWYVNSGVQGLYSTGESGAEFEENENGIRPVIMISKSQM